MKVLAAYMLAGLGNEKPSVGDVKQILESVGAEIDQENIGLFFSLIKDQDVTKLIALGREKMAALSSSAPAVAVAVAVAVPAGGAGGTAATAAAEVKKKEEEKEEESEDDGGMMSLFD